ncbi:efflux RND transporter periplasmic adaptor subunit [Lutibacter sp. B2]|nr:efflux RND transporter periplasmic adaptor subunit [Lutibacter sp. B2]
MKKFKAFTAGLLILVMAFTITGCTKKEAYANKQQKKVIPIEVTKIGNSTVVEEYSAFGKLYASEEVIVSSKTKGEVKKTYFNVGDKIKKGNVLYTLDNDSLMNDYDIKISSLEKNIKDLEIKYNDILRNYNNTKQLYESGVVSKNDFDSIESSYNQIALSLDQARKDLDLNTTKINIAIEDTVVKSPINGIIAEKNVEEGEMNGNADFKIINIDQVTAKVNVPETIVNRLSVGDNIEAVVDALNKTYNGKISSINPLGEGNNATYPIEIEMKNENLSLKPGMFVKGNFQVAKIENQIQIPKKAILKTQDEEYVYTVIENKPKKVVVETGIVNNGFVQIKNGLKTGDPLIVKGHEYVDENSDVKIVN